MKSWVFAFCLLIGLSCSFGALPSQLSYQVGQEFEYNLASTLDAKGHNLNTNARTAGATSTLNSIMLTKCIDEDATSYLFIMNLFETTVNVGQGASFLSKSVGDDSALGADMYYQQLKTGEIVKIWYQTGDSMYFVNVKVGAINSFQTHVVAPNQQLTTLENDPVGSHYSAFVGGSPSAPMLNINKTFTQLDFQSFPDPNLKQHNIRLNAFTQTSVHPAGYIHTSTVNQMVDLVSISATGSASLHSFNRVGDSTPLDVLMSSYGTLGISLATSSPKKTSEATSRFKSVLRLTDLAKAVSAQTFQEDTLFSAAQKIFKFVAKQLPAIDIDASLNVVMDTKSNLPAKKMIDLMNKVAKYCTIEPKRLAKINEFLTQKVKAGTVLDKAEVAVIDRIFYILTHVEVDAGQKLLWTHGLQSKNSVVQNQALLSVRAVQTPRKELVAAIVSIIEKASSGEIHDRALLAYGSVVGKMNENLVEYRRFLINKLKNALASDIAHDILTALHAIGNAGPSVVSVKDLSELSVFSHHDEVVRATALYALRKYLSTDYVQVSTILRTAQAKDSSIRVRKTISRISKEISSFPSVEGDDFPFNRSVSKSFTLGGSEISATFAGSLFAGTNFDCSQTYFNYKAEADASASLSLFGVSKQALLAEAVYGKDNGVSAGDKIFLQVWDDVIYDQPIPQLDCQEHVYPLGHVAPGFSVSYTLWVTVIPVVFSASADLDLNLQWGWQICDSQLSALVELVPAANLVISGEAEIDLLIIRAAAQVSGSFNSEVKPQGFIHGSQCQVGFDIEQVNAPMSLELDSYYQWRDCKLWIFDCHWGTHNQQTWYSWNLPAATNVLFEKDWQIKP